MDFVKCGDMRTALYSGTHFFFRGRLISQSKILAKKCILQRYQEEIEDFNMSTMVDAIVHAYLCGDEEMQIPTLTRTVAEIDNVGSPVPD